MFCSLHKLEVHNKWVSEILGLYPDLDESISKVGHKVLRDGYLLEGETAVDRLAHACVAYATSFNHACRLADYIRKGWFMFATPLLSNAGTSRGLPISCYLNYVPDSRQGLADHYAENIFLSTYGGGIGAHWSDVRSQGEVTTTGSETTGVIPFIKVADSQTLAFNQGKTRRGAYAAYLDVSHPEIYEFLRIRSSDGGDENRKCYHTNIGVNITDSFMLAVEADKDWNLIDPNSGEVTNTVKARDLMGEIIKARMTDRGQPYLFFSDTASEYSSYSYDAELKGSNLCTEITLKTDENNTAVCCLSSVNAVKYTEWCEHSEFIADLVEMLDNTIQVFIDQAPDTMHKAVHSAYHERSIGLGVMGYHSYLQTNGMMFQPFTSLFNELNQKAVDASEALGKLRGIPTESSGRRNTHLLAIAPNASSSLLLGVSPGVEPIRSNVYTIVQKSVVHEIVNPYLKDLINYKFMYMDGSVNQKAIDDTWKSIREHGGSIQHLDIFDEYTKLVYRTFSEINQKEIITAASLHQPFICQAQSINLCFTPDADPKHVYEVHKLAWTGVHDGHPLKSLYYLRVDIDRAIESTSVQAVRDDNDDQDVVEFSLAKPTEDLYTECAVCAG